MTSKKIIILSIIAGLVLLASAVFIKYSGADVFKDWLNKITGKTAMQTEKKAPSDKTEDPAQESIKKIKIGEIDPVQPKEQKTEAEADKLSGKDDLKRMAAAFAERFGSYSNQSNYSNINDLRIFMSQRMSEWAQDFIKNQQKKEQPNEYYGITTKALIQEILEFDEIAGQAIISVATRRREASAAIGNYSEQFNQNITINFIKESGVWKVDSAVWEQR